MRIAIGSNGRILTAGYGAGWEGLEVVGLVPDDFMQSFTLGKYIGQQDGSEARIVAVPGWVSPPPPHIEP